MEYGYEKVLDVQRRCGVSFEEADKALKAEKGDVDKACAYAMRKKKVKKSINRQIGSLKHFITYRIKISKDGETKFDISTGIIILISLLVLIFSFNFRAWYTLGIIYFVVFAVAIFSGYTIKFSPKAQEEEPDTVSMDGQDEDILEKDAEHEVKTKDDGYNSIEIK